MNKSQRKRVERRQDVIIARSVSYVEKWINEGKEPKEMSRLLWNWASVILEVKGDHLVMQWYGVDKVWSVEL